MHWTIKTRLLAMGALGVGMAMLLGGIGFRGLKRVATSTHSINQVSAGLRNHLESDMMHDALRGDVLAALLASTAEDEATVRTDLAEHSEWFRKMLTENQAIDMGAEVKQAIGDTKPALEAYIGSAESIIALAAQDKSAARAHLPEFLETFKDLEGRMEKLSSLIEATNEGAAAAARAEEKQATQLMVVVGIVGAILLLGASAWLIRSVIGPLEKVVHAMKDISDGEGDLTKRMDIHSKDEIGALATAFDVFITKMHDIIMNVRGSAENVSQASRELTAASDTISSSAQQQASSLEETAASLEEITATIKQNADNAGLANQLAANARDVAEKGGRVVANAVTAMSEINDSSRKIADIITTIDEIAFQTNLLALNAAVEAARAGEQGRGFAVVASEVRSLAQRSASAAREIKGLIGDSVKKVEDGSQLVNRSGATLEEIVTAVKRVTDVVAEIAAASREQSVGVEEVNKAVTQMDQVTQSNAAQTEELSATAGHLSDQAREVLDVVSRFQLAQDAARSAAVVRAPASSPRRVPTPIAQHPAYTHASAPAPSSGSAARTGTDGDGFEEF